MDLPPITPPDIYYAYTGQEPWPMLFGGGMHALDIYGYDPDNPSTTKFPEWFDNRFFFTEFTTTRLSQFSVAGRRWV